MTDPSELKPYITILARLRLCLKAERQLSAAEMAAQDRVYARSLAAFALQVVNSACEELSTSKPGDSRGYWPDLPSLMALCREHEKLAGVLTSRKFLPSAEVGATVRNEALLLLGMFRAEAATILGAPSPEWNSFVAEAARVWGKVRPEGGLQETDAIRSGRAIYGFALEAWARWYLRLTPLHPAYVREATREAYREMTGQEIQLMTREQDPLGPEAYDVAINAKPQRILGVGEARP